MSHGGFPIEISAKYRAGKGNCVVFIHGLGCTKECFDAAFRSQPLGKSPLLSFDLPGFGASSRPQGFSYRLEEQAQVCMQLLADLDISYPHLVAHSMGGAIAILLAEEMGGKIKSLSNAEGNLIRSDSTMSRRMSSVSFKAFSDRLLVRLKRELLSSHDKGMASWARMMEKSDPLALYLSAKSLLSWSETGELLEKFMGLKEKKAYFYGDSNSGMAVLGKLDGVEALSIPSSGHFMMTDNPSAFYKSVAEFICSK